jgi:uncharacterized integral membrane protein
MRLFTWLLILILTVFVALVLVLTFMQPAFKTEVGAQILMFKTRTFPVYMYVLGAFAAGLLIGVLAMVLGLVRTRLDIRRKNKRITELETKLGEAEKKALVAEAVRTLAASGIAAPGQQSSR